MIDVGIIDCNYLFNNICMLHIYNYLSHYTVYDVSNVDFVYEVDEGYDFDDVVPF